MVSIDTGLTSLPKAMQVTRVPPARAGQQKIDLISHFMVASHNIIHYHRAVHYTFKVVCE